MKTGPINHKVVHPSIKRYHAPGNCVGGRVIAAIDVQAGAAHRQAQEEGMCVDAHKIYFTQQSTDNGWLLTAVPVRVCLHSGHWDAVIPGQRLGAAFMTGRRNRTCRCCV